VVEQLMSALTEIVLPKFEKVGRSGGSYMVRCPAHEDGSASLSIAEGKDQPVVFHCFAGCRADDILAALGLDWEAVTKPREPRPDRFVQPRRNGKPYSASGSFVATYEYHDEVGTLLFEVCRTADKKFRQRRPDPDSPGRYLWSLGDTRRILYRLPEVIAAVKDGKIVYIAEGEKDVENIRTQGFAATCNSGGAGKWRPEYAEFLREAVVIICADKDEPGQVHARQVRDSLVEVGATVEIVEGLVGKDVSDHLAAGYDLAQLEVTWTNDRPAKVDLAPDLDEFLSVEDEPYDWLVPDLLERGDRVLLTGFEGLGKSVIGRQLGIAVAAGIHPFMHHQNIEPHRVLVIDCENTKPQNRRMYRKMRDVVHNNNGKVNAGMWRIIHRPDGIDLTTGPDAEWLMERVTAHQPELLIIGPFYKLHNANMNEEGPARKAISVLDHVRTSVNCCLLIEAHAGHGEDGAKRSVRPTGSSLLMRWPEFGIGITPCGTTESGGANSTVEVKHWRGQRDQRNWPRWLTWGDPGDWPWKIALGNPQEEQQKKQQQNWLGKAARSAQK
jgi:5S rRNA maturation endonuclease (ribonuclease M5)